MESLTRFAVYLAPDAAHPLWDAGCRWLGRDPSRPGFRAPPREATAEPRRYGFHATLKPPMALRTGAAPAEFFEAIEALAARTPRFDMPALEVGTLAGFVALRPVDATVAEHPLRRLADSCMRELDVWRAPLTERELQRRLADRSLSPAQKELLQRWGYPHAFEHWRFHMTLTDTVRDDAQRDGLRADAQRHFATALVQPLACDSLCVFTEPAEGEPFVLSHRVALGR